MHYRSPPNAARTRRSKGTSKNVRTLDFLGNILNARALHSREKCVLGIVLRRLCEVLNYIRSYTCYRLSLGKSQRRLVSVILAFVLAFLFLLKGVLNSLKSLGYDCPALCGKRNTVTLDLGINGIIDIWGRSGTQQAAGNKEKNVFLAVRNFINVRVGKRKRRDNSGMV